MPFDMILIATAAISALAPFLLEMGQSAGKKMAETIGKKTGEVAAHTGQSVWEKLTSHPQAKSVVDTLARKPDDPKRKEIAIEDLTACLRENPSFAHELTELLGGQDAIQSIIADKEGRISAAKQTLEGGGRQTIAAKNKGVIEDVEQIKKK